ncbi:hypothetical protein LINGRAHAP2_LOCUS9074 [Linum grandiflorum]
MRRAEKRKKFHDALLKSRYPQSPEPNANTGDDELPASTSAEEFDVNLIPDDYGLQKSGSSSSTSDTDGGSQKLSRAQRKRLRKKKIKEDASRRKGIIGPLLPPPAAGVGEAECSPGVRRNAEESGEGSNDAGVGASRVNQRRKAKKMAKEKLKSDLIKDSADDEKC